MFNLVTFTFTIVVMSVIAITLWIASRINRDVAIVDSIWTLMILAAALCFLYYGYTLLP